MDNIKITTLDSGLRIVTASVPYLSSATVAAFVNTGSRSEEKEINGLSHFLEHMAFKGTENRSVFQIANEVERIGASMNAYTSKEITAYYVSSLAEHIELSVDIISDVLINSVFPQEELDRERGVVLQEIARAYDDPFGLSFGFYDTVAYPNQNYGRTILGDPEFIKTASRDDFKNYMNKHYTTGNMIVVGAGNVDHDKFVELVAKYFAGIKVGSFEKQEAALHVGGQHIFNKEFEQTSIVYGFKAPTINDTNKYAASMFDAVLSSGMSSPLFTEVREKRGLVYSVGASFGPGKDYGDFVVYAGTTPNNLTEFFDVSTDVLLQMTQNISDEDMFRSLNRFKTGYLMNLERPFSLAQSVVSDLFNHGEVRVGEFIEKIESVTKEDISNVAKEILSSKPTLSMVGPAGDKDFYDFLINKFQ